MPAGFSNLPEEEQQVYLAALVEAHREKFEAAIPPPPIEPQYEVRDVTWAEETEMLKRCIVGALVNTENGWEGIPKDQAIAIRDRLINEIPAAGFLEMGEDGFAYIEKYELELKPGDTLLIK